MAPVCGCDAQIGQWSNCAFSPTDLSRDLRGGDAERGDTVQHGNSDLELRDLTVEGPRHESLIQQFRVTGLRFTQCIFVSPRLSAVIP